VDDDLIATAGRLESQAVDLERVAAELRRQAADLRAAKPAELLPALISIKEAVQRFGLSEWAVRKLLEDGTLREVRVGDRRLIQTSSLVDLAGAA
jgi:excisionase family DNA binding protein